MKEIEINIQQETKEKAEEKTEDSGPSIWEKMAGKAMEVTKGWGKAAGIAAGQAVMMADSVEDAMESFSRSTNVGAEDLAGYQEILENVYKNNYGESFDEIAGSMAKMSEQGISDMVGDPKELERAVEYGFLLRDTYGIDVEKGIEETAAMMKQFGISADEAYGMIAKGAADGLYQNGEFGAATASLSEIWDSAGMDAETALTKMQEGIGGTNDVLFQLTEEKDNDVGDLFEEMNRSVEALLLPLGEELMPILASLMQEALPLLQEGLQPLIELFGTFAEQVAPIAQEIFPMLSQALSDVIPILTELAEKLLSQLFEIIAEIMPILVDIISNVLPILVGILEAVLPPLMELVGALLPPLLEVVNALLPSIQYFVELLQPLIGLFMELLLPILDLITLALVPLMDLFAMLVDLISYAVIGALDYLLATAITVFGGFAEHGKRMGEIFMGGLQAITDFINNVFAGNWQAAWENLMAILDAVFNGLLEIVSVPINFAIDLVNGLIKGINSIKLPDWFPFLGGQQINISLIPRLKGGIDFVDEDFMPAFLDYGERVLTQNENTRFTAMGGLQGMEQALSIGTGMREETKVVLGKGCIVVESTLDGRKVGQSMAPYIDLELGEMEARKVRGIG